MNVSTFLFLKWNRLKGRCGYGDFPPSFISFCGKPAKFVKCSSMVVQEKQIFCELPLLPCIRSLYLFHFYCKREESAQYFIEVFNIFVCFLVKTRARFKVKREGSCFYETSEIQQGNNQQFCIEFDFKLPTVYLTYSEMLCCLKDCLFSYLTGTRNCEIHSPDLLYD